MKIRYCLLPLLLCLSLTAFAQSKAELGPLVSGQPVEREIAGGESHTYQVPLQAGEFLRVVLEQKGIDVAVALNAPDGKQLVEVNLSGGAFGREQLSHEVATAGAYQIVVRTIAATAVKGNYQVLLELKAAATARDKQQLAAERLLAEAIKSNLQGPAAASQAAGPRRRSRTTGCARLEYFRRPQNAVAPLPHRRRHSVRECRPRSWGRHDCG